MNRMIYTIGRQFGSGGRNIGKYIAEKENIPFYDKELLEEAAKESGISEKYFEDYDEKIKKHFFQVMPVGTYSESSMPFVHKVILAQFDAIRKLAKKGPCVFVGRCADYILRERPDVVRIFIRGDIETRKKRAVLQYGVPENKVEQVLRDTDRSRAEYYTYYTGNPWNGIETYDLILNSSRLEDAAAADVIIRYAKAMKGELL